MSAYYDYSTLLVLDCKYTIWEGNPPSGQKREIVRIDVAVVDTVKTQIVESEIIHVKPKTSKVSKFCSQTFNVDPVKVEAGIPFEEAYRQLLIHYMSIDRLWASWGNVEKAILDNDSARHNLKSLLAYPNVDLQHLYSLMLGVPNAPSIEDALKRVEIKSSGNDARDIAEIYLKIVNGFKHNGKVRVLVQSPHANRTN